MHPRAISLSDPLSFYPSTNPYRKRRSWVCHRRLRAAAEGEEKERIGIELLEHFRVGTEQPFFRPQIERARRRIFRLRSSFSL